MKYLLTLISFMFMTGCCPGPSPRPVTKPKPKIPMAPRPQRKLACVNRPIVVAIIDTGFGFEGVGKEAKLCKFGHKDFTDAQEFTSDYGTTDLVPVDHVAHGTNIAGVIQRYADKSDVNYCLVILKYYDPDSNDNTLTDSTKAIEYATNIKVDYINYSSASLHTNDKEKLAIENFIVGGGKFIASAGNDHVDLDKLHSYPASYPGVISVGNLSAKEKPLYSSNYGKSVKAWEVGENVEAYGIMLTGTSQAAAVHTGKLLSKEKSPCN